MSERLIGDIPACCSGFEELTPQQDTWDDVEHDRTGGPSYGIPLQEQVESTETHNRLLEDALTKCTDVIAALMGERKDLADQVYQAQVDAQDWQNKYRTSVGRCLDAEFRLQSLSDGSAAKHDLDWIHDLERQRETLELRVFQLTHDNTQLELKLETLEKGGLIYTVPDNLVVELQDLRAQNTSYKKRIDNQALTIGAVQKISRKLDKAVS